MKAEEFFQEKKQLLKNCIRLSEEILSNLQDFVVLETLITQREAIIDQIVALGEQFQRHQEQLLWVQQKDECNQLLTLLLDLDQRTIVLLTEERQNLFDAMKQNEHNKRIVKYSDDSKAVGNVISFA